MTFRLWSRTQLVNQQNGPIERDSRKFRFREKPKDCLVGKWDKIKT